MIPRLTGELPRLNSSPLYDLAAVGSENLKGSASSDLSCLVKVTALRDQAAEVGLQLQPLFRAPCEDMRHGKSLQDHVAATSDGCTFTALSKAACLVSASRQRHRHTDTDTHTREIVVAL